jgi:hypothetical protein
MSLCEYEPCQIEVFGRQKFCSADHRKATARARPEAREEENASARERYKMNTEDHTGRGDRKAKLWPCTGCQGLIYHVSKPRDVCAECGGKSQLISIRVAPRVDDPLRPVMVYFGTMNVSTRYVDADTVRLLCGVPEAIEPLATFARQLDGVAIIKQGTTGIDILEALIPASALRVLLEGRAIA